MLISRCLIHKICQGSLRNNQQLMDQMRALDYGDVCSLSNNERRCSIITGVLIRLNVDQRRCQL